MGRAIGIDLGTTYSLAAVMEGGRPVILPNAEGSRLTPSRAALLPGRGWLAGAPAGTRPDVVRSIKRRMGSDLGVRAYGRDYSPEEISSFILAKLKRDAESLLGGPVEEAVITVPAYFTDKQRKATREAGRLAGLKVLRLLSEPTAAALAYGLCEQEEQTVLVWDLGGGTFDVSVLAMSRGFFQVQAVNGDPALGGDDYDLRVTERLAAEFQERRGVDPRADPRTWQRLKDAAEAAKKELSTSEGARIRLCLPEAGESLEREIARTEFEHLTRDLTLRMAGPTRQALADANLSSKDIDHVLLVGGATRMPAVAGLCRKVLGQDPFPHSLNPDEAVALGAAIQAGMLSGAVNEVTLVDVTPLSLGVQTQGGLCSKIIARNSPIPVTRSRIFTAAEDGQASVEVHVLQGERALAQDNASLGRFRLEGIEPQARGQSRIEVKFEIDVDGIVRVSAWDLQADAGRSVEITGLNAPSDEERRRILSEARDHAEEDRRREEEVETRLRADAMTRAAELAIREAPRELPSCALDGIKEAVLRARAALLRGDSGDIRAETARLEERIRSLRGRQAARPP